MQTVLPAFPLDLAVTDADRAVALIARFGAVLPGAVHAFFSRYGPQRGDGLPGATWEQIVRAVAGFLDRLLPR